MQSKKTAILGAGISGLATAFYLKKLGFEVSVFEKFDRPGGQILSVKESDYLLDKGAFSGIETTGLIPQLVEELKLTESFIYAGEKANRKQVRINGRLFEISMNPENLFKFPLFTFRSKFRFFIEPFIPRTRKGARLAVAEFIKKRLGDEFLSYIIEPFSSEVYAGDTSKLSIEAAYPKLFSLEQQYGSVIKGFKKAPLQQPVSDKFEGSGRLFSFTDGMETLTSALGKNLGYRVNFLNEIQKIEKNVKGGYSLLINRKGEIKREDFDLIVSALPAYTLADAIQGLSDGTSQTLRRVEYVPLVQAHVAYLKSDLGETLKGYTVLIPAVEKKEVLNITPVSEFFTGRCPEERILFSVIMGGAKHPDVIGMEPDNLKKIAINTIKEIYKAKDKPVFVSLKSLKKAVPQYNTDYYDVLQKIAAFEAENPGLFITGNFLGGVSIGDSILSSFKTAERVARQFPQ
ncbi:MAG: protoporphyrinogen oxidase [Ignavibacteriales bacterium]|nr:MAG: protoporphyrinogen oxidase [Ignavibacteriaceae bacterium]MBW7873427.1 protoporphyrinogen oxidase [Ignavibacteria bacterium]MCZ2142118.1 protoporphyrinogen oxidase [Ignavibacteriales bacterium]OQY75688.1 MAG: protoporphyrinogen oxidase [Ignavibacteriales bacterium UTCHB3]MBV6444854.1 Protoporphyrinogen oxidase [Ignavibacteriaceae bacterium]